MRNYYTFILILFSAQLAFSQNGNIDNRNILSNSIDIASFENLSITGSGNSNSKENNGLIINLYSKLISRDIYLFWESKSNENFSACYPERKDNDKNSEWKSIGSVKTGIKNTGKYSYTDRNLQPGNYSYRLKYVNKDGTIRYFEFAENHIIEAPKKCEISHNIPNAFNPFTTIYYQISSDDNVLISILSEDGKIVDILNEGKQKAGYYEIKINTSLLKSGKYYYKIQTDQYTESNSINISK